MIIPLKLARMTILYLFLFLFNFGVRSALQVPWSHFVYEDRQAKIVTDPRFILGHAYNTGHFECAFKCHVNYSCQSYFYTAELQHCQLNNIDFWIVYWGPWSHRAGSEYFYKAAVRDEKLLALQQHSININSEAQNMDATVHEPTTDCLVTSDRWTTIYYSDMSKIKYRVFTDKKRNQSEAWDLCRNQSAELLRFDTLSHLQTFRDEVLLSCSDFQDVSFWVDGSNNNMVDKYVVTNGQQVPSDLWDTDKPKSPKRDHCIVIARKYHYKLDDTDCSRKIAFTFCQTR